jgi:hypothetical protein
MKGRFLGARLGAARVRVRVRRARKRVNIREAMMDLVMRVCMVWCSNLGPMTVGKRVVPGMELS